MLVRFSTQNGDSAAVNPDAVAFVLEICRNGRNFTEITFRGMEGAQPVVRVSESIETVINQLNDAEKMGKSK